jgi:hypothetical protein
VKVLKRNRDNRHEPTIAPGIDDDELTRDATKQEVERGDYTNVTRLSFDEHENGVREE